MPEGGRPLVAVSLKAYFGVERTRSWVDAVGAAARTDHWAADVDVLVVPSPLLVLDVAERLAGTGLLVGAQDVDAADAGPYTGDTTAEVLAEAGVRVVEIGHAERRRRHGETDAQVAQKAAGLVRHGLVPMVCVGEPQATDVRRAVESCLLQLDPVLELVGDHEVVVAYEPVWAIGAASPANPDRVSAVAAGLRERLGERGRIVYGGTAGPGLLDRLGPGVDGLFLGRLAHDPAALGAVVSEAQARTRRAPSSPS